MDPFRNSLATVAVHAASMLLVAGLLRSLGAVAAGRPALLWAGAWAALAAGLVGLRLALEAEPPHPAGVAAYWLAQLLFGFLVRVGCRELAGGAPPRPRDWLLFLPFTATVLAPAEGAPLPALVMVLFLGHSWRTLGGYSPGEGEPGVGLALTRLALAGLCALFAHTGLTAALHGGRAATVAFWPLYELLLQSGLAFGMVVLAGDRIRGELERRNRQLAEATAELERAAQTDPLTGLLNRRGLARLVAFPHPAPFVGVLAVLDLNHFKKLNDAHGHQAGDVALQLTARALRHHLRVTDPIVRTGGDEFVVLMPGGDAAELERRLDAVSAALAGQRLPGVAAPVDLRAAWGIAAFADAAGVWPAVTAADAAMYRAKAEQRR